MKTEGQKIFFGSNLKFLRNRRKQSQSDLAEILGVTRSKLALIEDGHTKSMDPLFQVVVSEYFKISIDSLLKIDLSKLGELKLRELEAGNDVYIKGGNLRILPITIDRTNRENIEYIPIKMKMGYVAGGYADPEFIEKLPKYTLPNLPKERTYRTFSSEGTSMMLPDDTDITGEFIQDWTEIKPDTPAMLVLSNQEYVFKKITVLPEGKALLAVSINSDFEPYEIPLEDVLEIWKFYCYTSKELPEEQTDLDKVLRELDNIKGLLTQ